ncbi:MAG: primosomal protein N' [Deltaproteobacteria bacterium]|nr:primosomal protein N' [Deltaproteobacteria bacterium]
MSDKKHTEHFVEVAVARPLSKTLTYRVPAHLCDKTRVGSRVLVPMKNTRVTGYVLGHGLRSDRTDIKSIVDVVDPEPLFPDSMVPFFRWIAHYYLYPIGEVIKGALPGGLTAGQIHSVRITAQGLAALCKRSDLPPLQCAVLQALKNRQEPVTIKALSGMVGRRISSNTLSILEATGLIARQSRLSTGRVHPKKERYVIALRDRPPSSGLSKARRRVLNIVERSGEISLRRLRTKVASAGPLAKKLAEQGLVKLVDREVYRDPFGEPIKPAPDPPTLTREQQHVLAVVTQALGTGFCTFLLHGVTGSGKTEVYMQAVAAALNQGHEALILVPEIGLISQTERRFRARFGDCVALLHSGLSPGERLDQWMRIVRHQAQIAIGARSAVFAPFKRLGLIVVDEEHDDSYKQETQLRYHARDLAILRAKLTGAVALLGSATPSVQSHYNVRTKKYTGLTLQKRIDDQALPDITVVDLRETGGARRAKPFITEELKAAMDEALGRGQQVLLFLNRRGFASCPTCTWCGQPVRCKHCDVTMTLHHGADAYRCHYCGYSRGRSLGCPACGHSKVKLIGLGTERVEHKIRTLFPEAKVARMDRDATARKGALTGILKDLRQRRIDILIGTQMVAKGHHFPNITLVGILCADLSLNFPDFRAGERTFQILAQVAGRAGRGASPGRVILQTFNPDHFCIAAATRQDYMAFYSQEIGYRKALRYPPYCRLLQVLITGKNARFTQRYAMQVGAFFRKARSQNKVLQTQVDLLGPVAAPLARLKQRYRWQMLLKGTDIRALHTLAGLFAESSLYTHHSNKVRVTLDVDPVSML